jgi:hypothetical protein
MADEINFETRFSKSRGLFPYVAGAFGLAVLIVIGMIITGIGRDRLPYADYFFAVRAPAAADGSEALSLQTLSQQETEKTVSIEGTVVNRTDKTISGLVAVIAVNDRFTLPVQTVSVPINPTDLPAMGSGAFQTTIPLGENGLGGYNLQFRLGDDGPFVPHRDERPPEPPKEPPPQPSDKKSTK